jgi:hypothetical protein
VRVERQEQAAAPAGCRPGPGESGERRRSKPPPGLFSVGVSRTVDGPLHVVGVCPQQGKRLVDDVVVYRWSAPQACQRTRNTRHGARWVLLCFAETHTRTAGHLRRPRGGGVQRQALEAGHDDAAVGIRRRHVRHLRRRGNVRGLGNIIPLLEVLVHSPWAALGRRHGEGACGWVRGSGEGRVRPASATLAVRRPPQDASAHSSWATAWLAPATGQRAGADWRRQWQWLETPGVVGPRAGSREPGYRCRRSRRGACVASATASRRWGGCGSWQRVERVAQRVVEQERGHTHPGSAAGRHHAGAVPSSGGCHLRGVCCPSVDAWRWRPVCPFVGPRVPKHSAGLRWALLAAPTLQPH